MNNITVHIIIDACNKITLCEDKNARYEENVNFVIHSTDHEQHLLFYKYKYYIY